jgi:hypothetical protein
MEQLWPGDNQCTEYFLDVPTAQSQQFFRLSKP